MNESNVIVNKQEISDLVDEMTLLRVELSNLLQDSNSVKQIARLNKKIELVNNSTLKQLHELQDGYSRLSNDISKSNSSAIAEKIEIMQQHILRDLKSISYQDLSKEHRDAVATSFLTHLQQREDIRTLNRLQDLVEKDISLFVKTVEEHVKIGEIAINDVNTVNHDIKKEARRIREFNETADKHLQHLKQLQSWKPYFVNTFWSFLSGGIAGFAVAKLFF